METLIEVPKSVVLEAIDQLERAQKDAYVQDTQNVINDLIKALENG